MGIINALARVTSLLVLAATFVVLSPGPASAVPAVCTTTYSAPGLKDVKPEAAWFGYSVDWIDIQVPDSRVVLDVDFGFEVAFAANSAELDWILNNPQSVDNVPAATAGATAGPVAGSFVLDDEAVAPFASPSPSPGRYRPGRAAAELEGKSAAGLWRLLLVNNGVDTGTWGNFTLTLTVDCDADKDGIEDVLDKCPLAGDPEQVDRDGDGLGDACDSDRDGDALADVDDGCMRDAAATLSGCPTSDREIRLRHRSKKDRLTITVASVYVECQTRTQVVLWRTRKGSDAKVATFRTNSRGKRVRPAPGRAGRYYVTAAPTYAIGVAECGPGRSKKVRLPRAGK